MPTPTKPRKDLTLSEKRVMFEGGTEPPFSGALDLEFRKGDYYCNNCHSYLFASGAKFDSGCGWPSFTEPGDAKNVKLLPDDSFGMIRTEVRCANCNAHLGHVFDDGPKEHGGQRYCINSVSLSFMPK
jgi:peptide-methionine (R)-S-oxide reductase